MCTNQYSIEFNNLYVHAMHSCSPNKHMSHIKERMNWIVQYLSLLVALLEVCHEGLFSEFIQKDEIRMAEHVCWF